LDGTLVDSLPAVERAWSQLAERINVPAEEVLDFIHGLQALWWLGKRSVTPLPPTTLHWFYEVRDKLQESGLALAPIERKPDYQALADVLKRAFKQLDKTFLDDL